MRPTEVNVIRMDEVHPGLRLIEKFHPPSERHPLPSIQTIAGIKGGGFKPLSEREPIR